MSPENPPGPSLGARTLETGVAIGDDGTRLAVRGFRGDLTLPAFVLVHGLASNARLWDDVCEGLTALDHTVFAVDLRGHGMSERPETGYDFATIAADVAAVVRDVIGRRAILVGQSWGANVVLETAARFPELAKAVMCIDGGYIRLADSFPTWPEAREALRPPRWDGMTMADLERSAAGWFEGFPESGIRGQLANFELSDDGTARPRLAIEHHMTILRRMWEHDPDPVAGSLDIPVRVLAVEGGMPGKRARVEAFAGALRNGRVTWTEGHHDIHAQRPAVVVDLLLDLAAEVAT